LASIFSNLQAGLGVIVKQSATMRIGRQRYITLAKTTPYLYITHITISQPPHCSAI